MKNKIQKKETKYQTFKIDVATKIKADELSLSVNEYVNHLIRLNDEKTSLVAEQALNKIVDLEDKLLQMGEKVSTVKDILFLMSEEIEAIKNRVGA